MCFSAAKGSENTIYTIVVIRWWNELPSDNWRKKKYNVIIAKHIKSRTILRCGTRCGVRACVRTCVEVRACCIGEGIGWRLLARWKDVSTPRYFDHRAAAGPDSTCNRHSNIISALALGLTARRCSSGRASLVLSAENITLARRTKSHGE